MGGIRRLCTLTSLINNTKHRGETACAYFTFPYDEENLVDHINTIGRDNFNAPAAPSNGQFKSVNFTRHLNLNQSLKLETIRIPLSIHDSINATAFRGSPFPYTDTILTILTSTKEQNRRPVQNILHFRGLQMNISETHSGLNTPTESVQRERGDQLAILRQGIHLHPQ